MNGNPVLKHVWVLMILMNYIFCIMYFFMDVLIVHTIKENEEALLVASKEIGLQVNADKLSTRSCLDIRL
jgi:hypothetical protein